MKRNKQHLILIFGFLMFFLGLTESYAKSAAHTGRHMIKEKTGRCFFYEPVTKTNLGWLSKEEMVAVQKKGIKPYSGKRKQSNMRQVYVPRDWCGRKNS